MQPSLYLYYEGCAIICGYLWVTQYLHENFGWKVLEVFLFLAVLMVHALLNIIQNKRIFLCLSFFRFRSVYLFIKI